MALIFEFPPRVPAGSFIKCPEYEPGIILEVTRIPEIVGGYFKGAAEQGDAIAGPDHPGYIIIIEAHTKKEFTSMLSLDWYFADIVPVR